MALTTPIKKHLQHDVLLKWIFVIKKALLKP